MNERKRLLINWVYYQPVGHAIEAYRYGQAFRNSNPDLEIAIALNARSAVELGQCIPAIDRVYPVRLEEFEQSFVESASLAALPKHWDYVFTDPRHDHPMGSDALDRFEQAFRAYIQADHTNHGWSAEELPPSELTPLALKLPAQARRFADQFVSEKQTRICMLFGSGTEASRTPPMPFWRTLIRRLLVEFADLEIVLLGALDQRRSITKGITAQAIDALIGEFPQVRNGFDLGLLNQLAIAERCDLHISPHTGMSFAIQCVGVPWLALSGAWAAEYLVNGVPFVSIYPACERYPCGPWFAPDKNPMLAECVARKADDRPFVCLTEASLEQKLPEIVAAARALIENKLSYLECARKHYQEMIPRLGKQDGEPFMEGWPHVLAEDFVFDKSRLDRQ
jgi:hypothetical protein